MELHPDLSPDIDRAILLGSELPDRPLRFGRNDQLRLEDANVHKYPEAVRQVLAAKIPLTLVSITTASHLAITKTDFEAMTGKNTVYLQRHSRLWLWFWTKLIGAPGAPVRDAAVVMAAAQPNEVILCRAFAGFAPTGKLMVSSRQFEPSRKVTVVSGGNGLARKGGSSASER